MSVPIPIGVPTIVGYYSLLITGSYDTPFHPSAFKLMISESASCVPLALCPVSPQPPGLTLKIVENGKSNDEDD